MKHIKPKSFILFIIAFTAHATWLNGHCQIPCGIYDDKTQFTILLEHVETIQKSITKIAEESKAETPNYNQLVRWVNNKEQHADEIKNIAAEYFLAQRIKPSQDQYYDKLELLHAIIVYAMKTKQSLDSENVQTLEAKIKAFKGLYLHHKH